MDTTLTQPIAPGEPASILADALAGCAREPIHAPGGVQTFGVLLALDGGFVVRRAAGSALERLGLGPADCLGRHVDELLAPESARAAQAGFADLVPGVSRSLGTARARHSPLASEAVVHVQSGVRFLELLDPGEEVAGDPALPAVESALGEVAAGLDSDASLRHFAQTVVGQFRALSGYDRVMVYRFDAEWNGEVVAEATDAELEPYLGLWYPSSDIPPQARELYLKTRVRVLADVAAPPAPLVPADEAPEAPESLDLSAALLRAMSPVHREYLTHMGVRATLVTSVVVGGKLWGLIACHHRAPRVPTGSVRRLAEGYARLLATKAGVAEAHDRLAGARAAQAVLGMLPAALGAAGEFEAALVRPEAGLLELLDAGGVAVAHGGGVWSRGGVPGAADLARLVRWLDGRTLGERDARKFVTASLGSDAPQFADLAGVASGVLAIRFSERPSGWLLWFRPELPQAVRWAGDPRKGLAAPSEGGDGGPARLTPRKSFEAWVEVMRGRSRAWTGREVALVDEAVRPNLTELLLRASREREAESAANLRLMQAVVEHARDGIVVTGPLGADGTSPPITYANPAFAAQTSYAADEVLGRSPGVLHGPGTDPATRAFIHESLRASRPVRAELLQYRKDRSEFWAEVEITPLFGPGGGVTHWVAVQRDVTERKKAEEALRESERRFRTVFDNSGVGMALVGLDGALIQVNPAICRMLGYQAEDLRAACAAGRARPPVSEREARLLAESLAGERSTFTFEQEYYHSSGRSVWCIVTSVLLRSEAGEPLFFIRQFQDITERKLAADGLAARDAQLREAVRFADALFEHSPVAIQVYGPDGTSLRMNEANRKLIGLPGAEAGELNAPTDPLMATQTSAADFRRAYAGEVIVRDARVGGGDDPEGRPTTRRAELALNYVLYPLLGAGGEVEAVVSFRRDVTERVRAERARRQSEERFRAIFDQTYQAIALLAPDGTLLEANETARLVGADPGGVPAELVPGQRLWETEWWAGANGLGELFHSAVALCVQSEFVRFQAAHHSGREFDYSLKPYRDGAGRLAYLIVEGRDITELRAAEAALREGEARLRAIGDNLPGGAIYRCRLSPEGETSFDYFSRGVEELLGLSCDEAVADSGRVLGLVFPEDRARRWAAKELSARTLGVFDCEYRVEVPAPHREGGEAGAVGAAEIKWVHARAMPSRRADGSVVWDGVMADVTERKRAELRMRQAWNVFSAGPAVLYRSTRTPPPACLAVTENVRQFGVAAEDLVSGRVAWDEVIHPDDRSAATAPAGDAPAERTYRVVTSSGEVRWVYDYSVPGRDDTGRAAYSDGYLLDITEQRAAQEALRLANAQYELLAGHIRDVISIHDAEGRFVYASPSCLQISGYRPDELVGERYELQVHPDDRSLLAETFAKNLRGEATSIEWRFQHKAGHWVWFETSATPLPDGGRGRGAGVVTSTRDITARKLVETQLRQAQKLEALGQLAGGVAHDFNNLLTVVIGCCELLLADKPAADPERPLLDDVLRAGERGAALTRQMLAFSRQQVVQCEVFDLAGLAAEAMKMLARLLGEDIALRTEFPPRLGRVKADPGQVEQVLMNLVLNARDAMPRGGTLAVQVAAAQFAAGDPALPQACRPGRYVRLSVRDTGHGMTPEVKARLFEPFFTTKPVGKGTGLGLATVYGAVQRAGGFLAVESEPGRGALFAAHFPEYDEAHDGPRSELARKPRPAGRETILVVEDDSGVRALTTAVLKRAGYNVIAAEDGAAALELWGTLAAPPDLVVTDVVMPGMSGRELAESLAAKCPQLKVVFLSGYTADAVIRHGVEYDRAAFLQKPYTAEALTRLVRSVLDQAPAAG